MKKRYPEEIIAAEDRRIIRAAHREAALRTIASYREAENRKANKKQILANAKAILAETPERRELSRRFDYALEQLQKARREELFRKSAALKLKAQKLLNKR